MNGKIYMIRNEVNGKRYIGQTVNSLEERFKQHKQGTRQPKKNMTKLQKAMDKYGKPMFTITMIEDHIETIELLSEREKFFIEKFNTKEEYNSTSGGENRLRTKTVKDDSELVIIHNDFNKEVIMGLTPREHDLLFLVLAKIKNKKIEEVNISFEQIRNLLNAKDLKPNELVSLSNSLWTKIKAVDYVLYAFGAPSGGVTLFSVWGINEVTQELVVQINPHLNHFTNSFKGGSYSSLSYHEFQETDDKYGKNLFRILSQWKRIGKVKMSLEDLEYFLDVPKSYKNKPYIFNEKVLKPAMASCMKASLSFKDLSVTKIKTGRKITGYLFSFSPYHETVKWVSPEERKVLAKQKRVEEKMEKQEQKSTAGSSQPDNTITQEEVDSILSLYFNKDEESFG